MLWPVHCVQNTPGADLHPDLVKKADDVRIYKGTDVAVITTHLCTYSLLLAFIFSIVPNINNRRIVTHVSGTMVMHARLS
jgi:hypothetical protein